MVLNDDAVHSDQTGGGKLESASIQFCRRWLQNCSTRLSLGRLDKISNANQSQNSAGGKSDSPSIFSRTDLPQSLSFNTVC